MAGHVLYNSWYIFTLSFVKQQRGMTKFAFSGERELRLMAKFLNFLF